MKRPKLYGTREAAEILDLPKRTVQDRAQIREGIGWLIGRVWGFDTQDLADLALSPSDWPPQGREDEIAFVVRLSEAEFEKLKATAAQMDQTTPQAAATVIKFTLGRMKL